MFQGFSELIHGGSRAQGLEHSKYSINVKNNKHTPFIRGKGGLKVREAEKTTSVSLPRPGKSFSESGSILGSPEVLSSGLTSVLTSMGTHKAPYMPTHTRSLTHSHTLTHSRYASAPGKTFRRGFPLQQLQPTTCQLPSQHGVEVG